MKRRWLRLLLLGVVSWLLFLVITFPAGHAYRMVQERTEGISLAGVDGTLWSGSAELVRVQGITLRNVGWQIHLWPLLLGRTEVALQIRDDALRLDGDLGRTLGGELYLKRLQGRLPVARVQQLTPYRVPALEGELRLEELELSAAEGVLRGLGGKVSWSDAVLIFGSPLELGGFTLQLQSDDNGITGTLRDSGGPLQAEGKLSLHPDGKYSFEGLFTPRDGKGELATRMAMLGTPAESGGYRLSFSGRLPLNGLFRRGE